MKENRTVRRILSTAVIAVMGTCAYSAVPASRTTAPRLAEKDGKLPLQFEPNVGQATEGVRYLSRSSRGVLLLRDKEAILHVGDPKRGQNHTVRMTLPGGAMSRPQAAELLSGHTNYLFGRDAKNWHTNVPNSRKVLYTGVYPGIDLVFYGNQQHLEY